MPEQPPELEEAGEAEQPSWGDEGGAGEYEGGPDTQPGKRPSGSGRG